MLRCPRHIRRHSLSWNSKSADSYFRSSKLFIESWLYISDADLQTNFAPLTAFQSAATGTFRKSLSVVSIIPNIKVYWQIVAKALSTEILRIFEPRLRIRSGSQTMWLTADIYFFIYRSFFLNLRKSNRSSTMKPTSIARYFIIIVVAAIASFSSVAKS